MPINRDYLTILSPLNGIFNYKPNFMNSDTHTYSDPWGPFRPGS